MKTLLLMMGLAAVARGQIAIYAVSGSTATSVGSTYSFGQQGIGSTVNVQFQVFNTGSAPVTISTVSLGGAGFTFEYPVTLPVNLPANSTVSQALSIWVSFTPTSTATFNASLTVSSAAGAVSVILLGSGVMAPTLTGGCANGSGYSWGSVPVNTSVSCMFALQNLNPQAVTVSSVVVNGLGFTGPYGVTFPLALQPQQAVSFSVNFMPPGAMAYSGTLVIGTQSYALSGTGQTALLPTPALNFDAGTYTSAQQGVLTVTLPSASPVAATGYVTITFAPTTSVVTDDSEIVFLANGSRKIPFSVSAGSAAVLLNGQSSAAFQTGTTEGIITFTLSTAAAMAGNAPARQVTIAGSKVVIDSATASKEAAGQLNITINGADNTYSAGPMTFAFFDASGNAIGSAVSSDFTAQFKSFYGGQTGGSTFQALVSFPVVGSVTNIGSVTVTLTNAAGTASTGSLTFQ